MRLMNDPNLDLRREPDVKFDGADLGGPKREFFRYLQGRIEVDKFSQNRIG